MPRQLRVEYPGAICHVMSRGDRQKDIDVELNRLKWKEGNSGRQRRGIPNAGDARRLGRETTLTIRQIGRRMDIGSWKSLNNELYLEGKRNAKESKSERAKK